MPITLPAASTLESNLNEGWGFQQHIGDSPTGRIALCRVWHGYVMAAYQDGSNVKVRFYDPYQKMGQNWVGGTTTLTGQTTATPVALCYLDIPPYLFAVLVTTQKGTGGQSNFLGFSWSQLPNIPDNSSQSYWDLSGVAQSMGSAHGSGAAGVLYGPSIQPLEGNVAIAYGQAVSGQNNVATLQAYQLAEFSDPNGPIRSPLNTNPVVYNTTNPTIYTICEPTLVPFGNSLLCFTVNQQNYIQVTNLNASAPSQVTTTTLQTDVAPAVTADPTGTIVILVYKQPGKGGQPLMFTSSSDGINFPAGQNLKTGNQQQSTRAAPAILALKTGQVLLAFQSGTGNGCYSLCPTNLWTQPNGLNTIPASS